MSPKITIRIGDRFTLYKSEYEITDINNGQIRYSEVAGGKIYYTTEEDYRISIKKKKIKILKGNLIEDIFPDNLSPKEILIRNRRLAYVREVISRPKPQDIKAKTHISNLILEVSKKINDENPPSYSLVCKWRKCFISSNKNPVSLIPNYTKKGKYARFTSEVEKLISDNIEKYYNTKQRLSQKMIHGFIKKEIQESYGLSEIPSEKTVNRRIADTELYKKVKGRQGIYKAKKSFKAAGKSIVTSRILETVEADGTILDILVVDDDTGEVMCRPYATCLLDVHSRCVIAFFVSMIPFSAATILKAMTLAISGNNEKFGGLFESLIVDNGSDYISLALRNFCNTTGIQIEHGAPRDPNSKPHVERFFGSLNSSLVHTLPGTTFSNPLDKGDYKSEKHACITMEQLNETIETWLENVYHRNIHRKLGRAPEKLWKESAKENPIITYPQEHLETIAREVETRRISKGRVTVHNLQWFSHALASLEQECISRNMKADVEVYIDTLDLEKVFIRDPRDHRILIQADSVIPSYTSGLSLYEHNKIFKERKKKGLADLDSSEEYQLLLAKWELIQKAENFSKEFSKKKIARLKETNKRNKLAKSKRIKKPEKQKNNGKRAFIPRNNSSNTSPNNDSKSFKSKGY